MLFPTLAFGLFFIAVYLLHWLTRPHPLVWRLVILGSSLFFYAWWNWRFVFLLLWAVSSNWFAGEKIQRALLSGKADVSRAWLRTAIASNLALLGVFKYYDFFAMELANLLGSGESLPLLDFTLPVGISFFTFQATSYIIDLHRRAIEPMEFLDFAVYLSFFPQLVAGPIVRASEMAPQISQSPDPRYLAASEAFQLILRGLFKKVVVSSWLASNLVDDVFANPSAHNGTDVLIGVYSYAIQIYADFSGYTDIAIGLALLLGFRFPVNFDQPYRALSLRDFWRRWHITLSTWLRDYLYIPLGGNKGSRIFTQRNLLLTMALGGLWHGSTWNFVLWGLIHGFALVLERSIPIAKSHPVIRWMFTFHVVCFAWIFFRAESLSKSVDVLTAIFLSSGGNEVPSFAAITLVAAALAMQFFPRMLSEKTDATFDRCNVVTQGLIFGLGVLLIDALGPDGVAPFIYFQF